MLSFEISAVSFLSNESRCSNILNFSFAPKTISTPGISEISFGFNCAKHPIITTKPSGFDFIARFTNCRHFLSAFSVTEHVLITKTSGAASKSTFAKPASWRVLPIVEVSEKFNLHPNV